MKARFRADPTRVWRSVHRGAWGPAPENSLAAIRAAAGHEVVEVDVQLDASGRPFLMHDDTLTRMTCHEACSGGAAPEVLADLRLREGAGGDGAPLTGEAIPRLDDAFAALDGSGAIFDLDVKHARDLDAVGEAVAALGRQDRATLKLHVSGETDLARLQALEAAHGVMVMAKVSLRGAGDLALIETIRTADIAAAELWFADLDFVRRARAIAGPDMRIGTYTLDPVHCCGLSDARALEEPAAVWGILAGAGLNQIMSDRVAELSRFLSTLEVSAAG